jgi:putative tricarboxylic transport membrane protein
MARADRISGIFWLVFSLFVSYQSYLLGLGTLHQPGPGFLFFWTAIVVAVLSLMTVLRSFRKAAEEVKGKAIFGKGNLKKTVLVLISILVYGLLMERLGFLIVTLLFFVFLLGVVERKRWSLTLLVSLIVTGSAYLVFEVWLQSQLPKGILGFLRF